jgi:hypothetical protein
LCIICLALKLTCLRNKLGKTWQIMSFTTIDQISSLENLERFKRLTITSWFKLYIS